MRHVQVESYANLAEPVLDAMRNFTPLAFDILTFLIIDRLASSKRQKLKVRWSLTQPIKAIEVLNQGVKAIPPILALKALRVPLGFL